MEEAKPYFLQAVKDEKGTQFESSAYEAILWYYVDFMQREVYDALDGYASERKLTNKNMNKLYKEVVTYLKYCGDKEVIIQKSVTSCVAQLELIILASELKAVPSLREVADNYVWQVSKKHFQNATASIPKDYPTWMRWANKRCVRVQSGYGKSLALYPTWPVQLKRNLKMQL
ncbi:hypothetical protein HCI99_03705 [Listeria booriae]|uniref:Uncharacterized protein n=1 Tax=Listeria booriae TaxID=1552123 RepID=A0A7X1CB22_9LIST|nr:hypothetical protein [Listeria booriae]MBC1490922.1 hypothetical protein [Listeria booriae]